MIFSGLFALAYDQHVRILRQRKSLGIDGLCRVKVKVIVTW